MMYQMIYWTIIKISRKSKVMRVVVDRVALYYFKIFRRNKTFTFEGRKYKYFYHLYNRTVASERIVEIPIAIKLLEKYKGKNILEVGNVISHYLPIEHDVLDKYEISSGVINEDVVYFSSKKKYDLIFSVSTLEHVGYSYGEKKDLKKFDNAVTNLKKLLKKDGSILITVPYGLNEHITKLIKSNKMPFTTHFYMKRVSELNDWKQISLSTVLRSAYYEKYYANANVIYIGAYSKKKSSNILFD